MNLTPTQTEKIETSKKYYTELGAKFELLGESEFSKGKAICRLTYEDGREKMVMIGKNGAMRW